MKKAIFFIGPVGALIFWWLIGANKLIDPLYFPSLPEVVNSFSSALTKDGFAPLWATTYRTLISFVIAGLFAVPLGIFLGSNKKIYNSLEFLIDFFRSLPAPALFPLFLLFFGIGDGAKIAVAFFVAFWVILINTTYGVWNSSKLRVQVGKVFRATRLQIFKEIIIPDALPQIFVGLRVALSLALIMVVVTEMFIGTSAGLGLEIFNSYASYRIPELYAFILIVGFLGYGLSKGFLFFERKTVHWAGK